MVYKKPQMKSKMFPNCMKDPKLKIFSKFDPKIHKKRLLYMPF